MLDSKKEMEGTVVDRMENLVCFTFISVLTMMFMLEVS